MGLSISTLLNSLSSLTWWGKGRDVRILMLGICQHSRRCRAYSQADQGLDASGKTTILYRLQVRVFSVRAAEYVEPPYVRQIGEVVSTIPS